MRYLEILVLLICLLLNVLFAIFLAKSLIGSTPFYPSRTKKLHKLFDELKINPKSKNFIDIGSGDGRFVIWAAKIGFNATGIEINPFLTLWSRLSILFNNLGARAKIERKDFYKVNYENYDIVYMYIYSEYMHKLENKLFSELKKGSIIISNTFKFRDIEPDKIVDKYKIYIVK